MSFEVVIVIVKPFLKGYSMDVCEVKKCACVCVCPPGQQENNKSPREVNEERGKNGPLGRSKN